MRGAFGLVSILVVLAIILYALAGRGCSGQSYLQTVMNVKKEKEPLAYQWGGRDVSGKPFWETLELAEWPATGSLKGLRVESVDPAGAAASHFGLMPGDIIIGIGPYDVGGPIVDSVEAGSDFLTEAYSRSFPITIRRQGVELVLPDQRGLVPPAAAPAQQRPSPVQGLPAGN